MRTRSIVVYTLLRLAFFLVPLAVMLLFPAFRNMWWLAVIFAALIGFSLSIILLQRPRAAVSESIHERRSARTTKTAREVDEDIEDEANEAAQAGLPAAAGSADEAPGEEESVDR